ncbi:MAG: hypothetical protein PHR06_15365 [Candidatus Cloacimonetes bacterium]|nr:hypothetical protein [Candidatus Cloacimonadota bacterium]
MKPKYDISVQLIGENGNAFNIIGKVRKEMKRNGVSNDEIDLFINEAMSGDYDNLLRTCMKYVNVE